MDNPVCFRELEELKDLITQIENMLYQEELTEKQIKRLAIMAGNVVERGRALHGAVAYSFS